MRTCRLSLAVLATLLWTGAGCNGSTSSLPSDTAPAVVTSDGGVHVVDLPCDIADLLLTSCLTCHNAPPANGAPQALNSQAALQAASPGFPNVSNGARAVIRMAEAKAPMPPPPNPGVPVATQANFAEWVDAGMPSGTCTTAVDAGTSQVDPAFAAAPACTSGKFWTSGESASMRPGEACIACHSSMEGPKYTIAGTAYPTGHEPSDCDSPAAAGAVITVTDVNGTTASFTANGVGNFAGNATLVFPITAIVTSGGNARAMVQASPSGDCNSCHTQTGANGAPGRIALP